uniref:Prolyl 4-hydroxylase alpha-subunit N-terminal domain-containing protein n=1 Tax=Clastoptera arizonana TaxID=38151 RepID=A0A1B6C6M5_9HEMI
MKYLIIGVICGFVIAEEVFNMGNYLGLVDENMMEILNEPFNKTRGRDLQFYMEDYYHTIKDLRKQMKKNVVGIDKSVDAYMAHNGPNFVDIRIQNYQTLQDTFKWNDNELEEFIMLRKNISDLWRVFKEEAVEFRKNVHRNP